MNDVVNDNGDYNKRGTKHLFDYRTCRTGRLVRSKREPIYTLSFVGTAFPGGVSNQPTTRHSPPVSTHTQ